MPGGTKIAVRRRLSHLRSHIAATRYPVSGNGPLEGVKVLDMTEVIAGPMSTMQLADMGAIVTKVEKANGKGDNYRASGTFYRTDDGKVVAASFATANRGKRSVVIDAASDDGRQLILELAKDADVFVQNMRPGVVEKLGIGYEDMKAVNPAIIYCSISGFGKTGPYSKKPTYDPLIQATAGLVAVMGRPLSQSKKYTLMNTLVADKTTAMTAVQAILAALYARDAQGKGGQHIDLAMYDVGFAYGWPDVFGNEYFVGQHDGDKHVHERPIITEFFGVALTKDDRYVTIFASGSPKYLQNFAEAFDRMDLLEDERFNTPGAASQHNAEYKEEMVKTLRKFDSTFILEEMDRRDMPGAPVEMTEDAWKAAQAQHSNITQTFEHPQLGTIREARPAPRLSATPMNVRGPPPMLGEHTTEVLTELGLSAERIAALRRAGVLGPAGK